MAERLAIIGERVRKVSRIEIEPDAILLRPADPPLELRYGQFVTGNRLAIVLRVRGMQISR